MRGKASSKVTWQVGERARPAATVSTPLRWEEVRQRKLKPSEFTVRAVRERLAQLGDLFAEISDRAQQLPSLPV